MRMLDEVFQLDDQFGEPFPHVKRNEELRVQECRRQLYDFEAMRLYDVAGVGVFTSRGEIVGLVPEGLEQEARDAMGSGIRAVVIDNFSLPPSRPHDRRGGAGGGGTAGEDLVLAADGVPRHPLLGAPHYLRRRWRRVPLRLGTRALLDLLPVTGRSREAATMGREGEIKGTG